MKSSDGFEKTLVSVVIPNWNGRHLVEACLDSLRGQTYKPIEVVVVDNGSTDGSAELITTKYPEVLLVQEPTNLGFAGGVNRGIREAGGEFVALLNNDAVAEPQWLENLVKAIGSDPKCAASTAKQIIMGSDPPRIDSAGDFYSAWGIPFPRGRGEIDTLQFDASTDVFAAAGGACLIRASVLEEIGLFDEDFFAYYEDVDFSFRARLKGYWIKFEPNARVQHEVGATSGGGASAFSRYHSMKNLWLLYLKDMPATLFWKYMFKFIAGQVLMLGGSIRKGLLFPHLRGLGRALLMTPRMIQKRKAIQGTRVVSTTEIDALLMKRLPPLQKATLREIASSLPFVRRAVG